MGVDVEAARRAPGVVDVVTAADLDVGPVPMINPAYPAPMARPLLAVDRVRFVGEAIVAILSETAAAGADAAELVEIDYDPLPAVVGIEAALTDESLLFPEAGTNLVLSQSAGQADPDACEVVTRGTFVNQRLAPCPLDAGRGCPGGTTTDGSCSGRRARAPTRCGASSPASSASRSSRSG